MWTVNDFPAYGMLSSWSTAGIMGCPIYMDNTWAFHLQHGRKACYFDCHRQFLKAGHPYRRNKKAFTKGIVEKNEAPPRLNGEEVWHSVRYFKSAIEDPVSYPPGYGTEHKWTKRRKDQDNLNARKDVEIICDRPEIAVSGDRLGKMTKAVYTLDRDQKRKILEWIKALRFPDGYTSNLGRCIDLNELKLHGMKSHDCHVFVERLIPTAFREMLPEFVWNALTEVSLLFQAISSATLDINKVAPSSTPPPIPPSPIVRETLSSSPTLPPSHIGMENTHLAPSQSPSPAEHYTWNPTDASQIRSNFNFRVGKWIREAMGRCRRGNKKADWMSNEVWAELQSVWASEKFQNISQINKINRQKNVASASTVEGLLGRPPSLIEQLEKRWKTKQGNWAGPRAEEAVEKFKKLNDGIISQHLPESSSSISVNDHQLWLKAIGGVKKGRIWSMGSETKLSTSRTSTTTNTVNPMPEQGESELVQKLLLENKTMRREIKHTRKEMQMLKMQFANKFGTPLEDVNELEDDSSDNDPPSDNHL
ncbi:UNVERIFIED_CONTAM: hypothetical protein Scaly_2494200 [Sesamum calycinum]|uniref:Uncharacterized protein n=1 Tax=Sesamum calycinum TaxID=2727403 RepID=A0AAW2LT25_9LAMI